MYSRFRLLRLVCTAIIVDEAHCISQWGSEFRQHYAALERLRAYVPPGMPLLAVSATLHPASLRDVCARLLIDLEAAFFLNLGNHRHNITMGVKIMDNGTNYEVLRTFLPSADSISGVGDFPKVIIFVDSVSRTQQICHYLRQFYPPALHVAFSYFHALCTPRAKRHVIHQFRNNEVRVLVATEAAGMVGVNAVLHVCENRRLICTGC